ncbi:hypothetical protein C0J52_13834 [Blattella germanica]|nr:hypothetical protein C0J52_13834 [Blattella germanica]
MSYVGYVLFASSNLLLQSYLRAAFRTICDNRATYLWKYGYYKLELGTESQRLPTSFHLREQGLVLCG